jgi:putative heme iron utilization protein
MAADAGRAAAQGLARVTVQGLARQVEKQSADEAACRAAYLGRFPDAEPLLAFGDFSFFLIAPTAARFVGGFAQATSVDAAALAEALR